MFDSIKNLLGDKTTPEAHAPLNSPDELMIDDIIKFQFMRQPELSNKQFQVAAIVTYDFEQENYPRFALKGENEEIIFLSVLVREGQRHLAISKKISREAVDAIFGLDHFAGVFEEGSVALDANAYAPLETWLGTGYYKAVDCKSGYRHIGDYRNEPLPQYEDDAEGIDYYLLRDKSEKFAVEIDVCDDSESDVYVTIYQPVSVIDEMWPSA